MLKSFNNAVRHLNQSLEDIGYGMVIPAISARRRYKESLEQAIGSLTIATGFLFPAMTYPGGTNIAGFLATFGGVILGSLIAEYQSRGEDIRQQLDSRGPQTTL